MTTPVHGPRSRRRRSPVRGAAPSSPPPRLPVRCAPPPTPPVAQHHGRSRESHRPAVAIRTQAGRAEVASDVGDHVASQAIHQPVRHPALGDAAEIQSAPRLQPHPTAPHRQHVDHRRRRASHRVCRSCRPLRERARVADGEHRRQHRDVDQSRAEVVRAQRLAKHLLGLGADLHPSAGGIVDERELALRRKARQTRAHLTDPLLPVCKLRPRDVHAEQAARSPQSLEVKRLDDGVRTHRWTSPAAHRPGARRVQT